jgi:hypothetical protein
VDRGVRVRPPEPGVKYVGFVDMSGGSSDACALAIGHVKNALRVVDGVWDQGQRPPFDPRIAVGRFAAILTEYRISAVTADTFGKEMLDFERDFNARGIAYHACPLSASELYEALEVPVNSGEVVLPDDPETLEQLAGLQHRGGKIGHRSGEHDDRANSLAGVAWVLKDGAPRSLAEIIKDIHFGPRRIGIDGPMAFGTGGQREESDSFFDRVQEGPGGAFGKGRRWTPDW